MKTIQELYNEVMENQELKEKFIEAANAGKQEDFLKEQGCEATLEEVAAFLQAKAKAEAKPKPKPIPKVSIFFRKILRPVMMP